MKPQTGVESSSPPEGLLFLRRWLAHPLKVGALLPSSRALARLVARQIRCVPDQAVVELGAGTGAVTRALLRAGVPTDRLFVVEIDRDLTAYLRKQVPGVQVIHGDASRLKDLLPHEWHRRISTVISGIPMVPLPIEAQQRLIDSSFDVMAPGGRLLQYTYSAISPLPERRLGLKGRLKGVTFLNFPPAWVWSYEPTRWYEPQAAPGAD
ncbi:MAG: class I SAM-dependent methyltransferase [Pseudomonadota bacterium]